MKPIAHMFLSLILFFVSALGFILYSRNFTNILLFIFLETLIGVLFNYKHLTKITRLEWKYGTVLGVLFFAAFASLMTAIQYGKNIFSTLIIISFPTVIATLIFLVILKEKLTKKVLLGIILALLSLILLQI